MFALLFLTPLAAVLARVLGVGLSTVARRPGVDRTKLIFNLVLATFETLLALTLIRRFAPLGASSGVRIVVATALALWLATMLGTMIVTGVVSIFEGGLLRRLLGVAIEQAGLQAITATMGSLAVSAAILDGRLAALPVLPVLATWLILRSHGRLSQDHRDLLDLHAFSGAVGGSLDLASIAASAVGEVQRLLRANSANLAIFDPETGEVDLVVGGAGPAERFLPTSRDDERWAGIIGSATPVVLRRTDDARWGAVLTKLGIEEVVSMTIADDEAVMGLLLVADREGTATHFDRADLARLSALAGQLTVSLRKGVLHDRLEREATHDRLTGFPNRILYEREVERALAHRGDAIVATVMVDLDRFKDVNDTLGHHMGDVLLQQFCARTSSLLEQRDVLARFAGDEFAILVSRRSTEEIANLASRLVTELRQPFHLGELRVVVSGSVGIALAPQHGTDVATLLRRADIAMYEAKSHHTGWELYRAEIDRTAGDRLSLLGELRTALEEGQLELYYQPKLDLRTSTIVGAEALVRWNHPTRGLVPPDEFIPLAEQTGLIQQLSDCVLGEGLAAARHWIERGLALSVAVNLSTQNLVDVLLADRVSRLLKQHGVPAEYLTLEITESAVMNDATRTMATLDRLHRLGVRLSVDDFGTGYSSLTYLRRLPVGEIKIDRSFVAQLLVEDQDEVIVRSTIDLGHNLGLSVVAEGVENEPIAHRLAALGCDIAQGYGISRPLPLARFDEWLAETGYEVKRAAEQTPILTATSFRR